MRNSERAGDQVFANVDQVLAEKIISRSKENSRAAAPVAGGGMVNHAAGGAVGADSCVFSRFFGVLTPPVKAAVALLALLALAAILFGRAGRTRGGKR